MFKLERDTLRVDVPVGFLLPEAREITVNVDRPADVPLAIRLRLIPARTPGAESEVELYGPRPQSALPARVARAARVSADDDVHPQEYGGGD